MFRFAISLVACCLCTPAAHAVTYNWSDLAVGLPNLTNPALPRVCLLVQSGQNIHFDVPAGYIDVLWVRDGSVSFDDNGTRALRANRIIVDGVGAFSVGTAGVPFSNDAEIQLTADAPCTAFELYDLPAGGPPVPIASAWTVNDFHKSKHVDRLLQIEVDGQLDLHGLSGRTPWTRLETGVTATVPTVAVPTLMGWNPGDKIVLGSTDFDRTQAELGELLSSTVSAGVETWTLTAATTPVANHFAGLAGSLDLRGEVGNLTRNVRVYSPDIVDRDDDCHDGGYTGDHLEFDGAEIRVVRLNDPATELSAARLSYIEVYNAGKFDILARYPIHFHMLGDASGSKVEGVSVHTSANRGVVLHGSQNIEVLDNVVYDVVGHGYYLEEGPDEAIQNVLRGNLAVNIHGCPADDSGDLGQVQLDHDTNASGFYFTNPGNVWVDNAVAGAFSAGFWYDGGNPENGRNLCGDAQMDYATPFDPLDTTLFTYSSAYDATVYPSLGLAPFCHGAFAGNTAHSAQFGLWAEQHKTQLVRVTDFTGYKISDRVINSKNQGVTEIVNLAAADNRTALWPATHAYHLGATPQVLLIDSVVVGESANVGNPAVGPRTYPLGLDSVAMYGVEVYEGHLHIADTDFELFDDNTGVPGVRAAFGRHLSFPFYTNDPDNSIEGLNFDASSRRLHFEQPADDASGQQMVMLLDLDGSLLGAANAGDRMVANDDFNFPDASVNVDAFYDSGANAWRVDDSALTYGQMLVQWCAFSYTAIGAPNPGAPRCVPIDPATGRGTPYTDWFVGPVGTGYYDVVRRLRVVDETDCPQAPLGCTSELRAKHSVEGTHDKLGANVFIGGQYRVALQDNNEVDLTTAELDDVKAMQIHFRYAQTGDAFDVAIPVPAMPSCVAVYDGESINDPLIYTAATLVAGPLPPPTSSEYVFIVTLGVPYVVLHPEFNGDAQSTLLLFGPACP